MVGLRSHKYLDRGWHVDVKRLSELLKWGGFGRTRPLSVFALPRNYYPDSSSGSTIEWTAVRDMVNRVEWRCWKWFSFALSAAASTTSTKRMAGAFIGFRKTMNFNDVFKVASSSMVRNHLRGKNGGRVPPPPPSPWNKAALIHTKWWGNLSPPTKAVVPLAQTRLR